MLKEDAIKKAQKLIALIDGASTEQEATAASLALQRLFAKEGITSEDVEAQAPAADQEAEEEGVTIGGAGRNWQHIIANTIAANYRCDNFYRTWGRHQITFCFVGLPDDLKVATKVFRATLKAAENCWQKYSKEAKKCMAEHGYKWNAARNRNSYLTGFARGIRDAYDEQVKQDQEMAIVLVKPEAVVKKMHTYQLTTSYTSYTSLHSASSYSAGRADGRSVGTGHAVAMA